MRLRATNGKLVYESDYTYLVRADSAQQNRIQIILTPGLPIPLVTVRDAAVCKSVDAARDEKNATLWNVKATFSSEIEEGTQQAAGPGSEPDDPTTWIPIRELQYERISEPQWQDRSYIPITNSAGQAFETAVIFTRFIPIWEFWQFDPLSVTDEIQIERNELVNEATYKGRDPDTLLLILGKSTVGFYYGHRIRLTQYFLKYNVKTWKLFIPDVGVEYLDSAGALKAFTDDDDPPHRILGNLDGAGGKVPSGDPPFMLEFDQYTPSDFSFLKI